MADFVGAVDQGTTSTRFMVFDHGGNEVARHQLEHQQILPRPGWVEHDPVEIWERTRTVITATLNATGLSAGDLAALGIANQRETTVVWNRRTGVPYANAIVWQDTRTDRIAAESDAVIRLHYRPGHFLTQGYPVATVWPPDVADTIHRRLENVHITGPLRTLTQDIAFGIDQLVEIAIRALSPAVSSSIARDRSRAMLAMTSGSWIAMAVWWMK